MDFYKSRVEELRQDNGVLFESRSVMEEQLKAAHKRIETVKGLESELKKYKEQRDALILVRLSFLWLFVLNFFGQISLSGRRLCQQNSSAEMLSQKPVSTNNYDYQGLSNETFLGRWFQF